MPVEVRGVRDAKRSGKAELSAVLQQEAQGLAKALPSRAYVLALDIKGRSIDSPGLAKLLTTLEVKGVRDLAVLIGGPFGLAQELLDRADTRLSLSRLTFTHEMARLICLEQLYRACTIRAGEPYHH